MAELPEERTAILAVSLAGWTTEDLQAEIERREKARKEAERPQPVDKPDWSYVVELCKRHVLKAWPNGWYDEDDTEYIYEAAVRAVYGPGIFQRLNARNR